MTNKERYIEWVASLEYVPIFMQPWWMDAVCAGKEWDVLLAEDSEGQILGARTDPGRDAVPAAQAGMVQVYRHAAADADRRYMGGPAGNR